MPQPKGLTCGVSTRVDSVRPTRHRVRDSTLLGAPAQRDGCGLLAVKGMDPPNPRKLLLTQETGGSSGSRPCAQREPKRTSVLPRTTTVRWSSSSRASVISGVARRHQSWLLEAQLPEGRLESRCKRRLARMASMPAAKRPGACVEGRAQDSAPRICARPCSRGGAA